MLLAIAWILPSQLSVAQDGSAIPRGAVQVQMRNVMYHFTNSVTAHIKTLNGEIVPAGNYDLPVFDDKNSFRIEIRDAEISISARSLANVLNTYVFARADAPLAGITVETEKRGLKIKGRLRALGDVPFELNGTLSPASEGKIRLHAEKIKALHIPVKGLMDLFGVHMAALIREGKVPGVTAEKDDLIFELSKILPPPHIDGRVTAIRIAGDSIVQSFSSRERRPAERYLSLPNYMSYRGNRLRFGKLTMSDSDMVLIDMDPGDPFDFYLDHYRDQLAAGYTKITPSFGLRVFMKDFNKLPRVRSLKDRQKASKRRDARGSDRRAQVPQNVFAHSTRVSAQRATSSRHTHSTVECKPAPPGPNNTLGMPASLSRAASVQKLCAPKRARAPMTRRAQSRSVCAMVLSRGVSSAPAE